MHLHHLPAIVVVVQTRHLRLPRKLLGNLLGPRVKAKLPSLLLVEARVKLLLLSTLQLPHHPRDPLNLIMTQRPKRREYEVKKGLKSTG